VRTPRAAFVDFPLGHTSGKPFEPELQREIVLAALTMATEPLAPATIRPLGHRWGHDAWRENPMGGGGGGAAGAPADGAGSASSGAAASERRTDSRVERFDTPQYQTEDDARLAAERLGAEVACAACVGFDA